MTILNSLRAFLEEYPSGALKFLAIYFENSCQVRRALRYLEARQELILTLDSYHYQPAAAKGSVKANEPLTYEELRELKRLEQKRGRKKRGAL
jgi:hypothetical protein